MLAIQKNSTPFNQNRDVRLVHRKEFYLLSTLDGSPQDKSAIMKEKILIYRNQVAVVLIYGISMQSPLKRVQAFPILLEEVYGYIVDSQKILKGQLTLSTCVHYLSHLLRPTKDQLPVELVLLSEISLYSNIVFSEGWML